MVASSAPSVQRDRQRTSKSALSLSPEQLLEIAQESISRLRAGGVVIKYFQKDGATVLKLEGVAVCFQCSKWQLWEHMTGNLCQQCTNARKPV